MSWLKPKMIVYKRILDNILYIVKRWNRVVEMYNPDNTVLTDDSLVTMYHTIHKLLDNTMVYSHINYMIAEGMLIKKGTVLSLPPVTLTNTTEEASDVE